MAMNVVHSGSTYQIYGDALKTYDKLPVGTYEVNFGKMTGYFLSSRTDLVVNEEKIYGPTPDKVEKVLNSFSKVNRNFGVILSGKKGIGKSLFARQLAVRAKDYNLPLIIVSGYTPGIADFISSIEQEVIVLFDEFEKTFGDREEFDPQEEMLSLFDGIDNGKKLFIITCNDVNKLNSYLINRPGRFHYHFVLSNPTPEEIREYMQDKLNEQYHSVIKKLVTFSMNVDLTYDVLRAIAFEINNGYSFEETLSDLNISKEGTPKYKIVAEFADGSVRESDYHRINIYSPEKSYIWINNLKISRGGLDSMRIEFTNSDVVMDMDNVEITLKPDRVKRYVDRDCFDLDDENERAQYENLCNVEITKITFEKMKETNSLKYLL